METVGLEGARGFNVYSRGDALWVMVSRTPTMESSRIHSTNLSRAPLCRHHRGSGHVHVVCVLGMLPEGQPPRRNIQRGNGVSGPPGASQIHSLGSLAREPRRGGSRDRVAGRERLPVLLVWKLEVSVCSVPAGLRSRGTSHFTPARVPAAATVCRES